MTDVEIQKLWEWCGFKSTGMSGVVFYWDAPGEKYSGSKLPAPTLDNLFQWAVVPKLDYLEIHCCPSGKNHHPITTVMIRDICSAKEFWGEDEDPTEALAQAILKVVNSKA